MRERNLLNDIVVSVVGSIGEASYTKEREKRRES
jgi:hypothetical protein